MKTNLKFYLVLVLILMLNVSCKNENSSVVTDASQTDASQEHPKLILTAQRKSTK